MLLHFKASLQSIQKQGQDLSSVCCGQFEVGDVVTVLPTCQSVECRGIFHRGNLDCGGIIKWLENHKTCPLCRQEVVVEDGCETEDE